MEINLIACINKVNALGKDNELLYHISSDLKNFKSLTMNGIIIMGKNTYESLPKKPLPNRTTIIICNEENYTPFVEENKSVFVADSIPTALGIAETLPNKNVWVIGGASIYRQFIEQGLVDKLYLTVVDDDTQGDVHFPTFGDIDYRLLFKTPTIKETERGRLLSYQFHIYEKNSHV